MPPKVALLVCFVFVAAVLVKDVGWRPRVSLGGWLPLVWVLIIGSRPITAWYFQAPQIEGPDVYLEGSPIDRMAFIALIVAALWVLSSRKLNWLNLVSGNRWVVVYFAFCLISVIWSDYPVVSFKRWLKDIGNVLMVLIVLTEKEPVAAVKALLLRCCYVLIPVSVVLIKYFPELARSYNPWTGRASYTGVTTDKNMLGMMLTSATVALCWALITIRGEHDSRSRTAQAIVYAVILALTVWLLGKANSATAIACSSLGVAVLLFLRFQAVRNHIGRWVAAGLFIVTVSWLTGAWAAMQQSLLEILGRDASLTGRREIWEAVLAQDTNPLFGVGYYSFWLGSRVDQLSTGYFYALNEAHNGYLETYLNIGLVGVLLLCMLMTSAMRRAISGLGARTDGDINSLRLTFVIVAIVYGFTEAVFSRLGIIWFCLLLVSCAYSEVKAEPNATGRYPRPASHAIRQSARPQNLMR